MAYPTKVFEFPGRPEIVREAVRRLIPEKEWVSPYGDRVECFECKFLPDGTPSPHSGEWALRPRSGDPRDRNRCATMSALELFGERLPWGEPKTVVFVNDGRDATWSLEKPECMGDVLVEFYQAVYSEVHRIVGERAAQAEAEGMTPDSEGGSKGGHPGLDRNELIYRLAKAQEAEEIRHDNPDLLWKEIAKAIQWNKGIGEPGLALLRDARRRLERLQKHGDPLLGDVAEYRAKETKKTKET